MSELYSTAHSPITDPHLHAWGWEIPVYLFLGGFTAGILVLCGWALFKGRHYGRREASFGLASSGLFGLGIVALSLGMLALFLDLSYKAHVWRLYLTFEPWSPMSWGAWILLLVYPVLVAGVLLHPPEILLHLLPVLRPLSFRMAARLRTRRTIGVVAMVSGIALGIYTGVLLSALTARPFWTTALLGPLFLVSGLSAAAAFAHMVSPEPEEREALARFDNLFLLTELVVLGLILVGFAGASQAHALAASLVLGGPMTAVFWVLVVGLGIVVPLVIQTLAVAHRIAHTPIGPVMVLLGGLALRFVVVYAGQWSRWPRL